MEMQERVRLVHEHVARARASIPTASTEEINDSVESMKSQLEITERVLDLGDFKLAMAPEGPAKEKALASRDELNGVVEDIKQLLAELMSEKIRRQS